MRGSKVVRFIELRAERKCAYGQTITGYHLGQPGIVTLEGKRYDLNGYLVICITKDPLNKLTTQICNGGNFTSPEITNIPPPTFVSQVLSNNPIVVKDEVKLTWAGTNRNYRMYRKSMVTTSSGEFKAEEWTVVIGGNDPGGTPGDSEPPAVSPTPTKLGEEGTMAPTPTPYGAGKGKGKGKGSKAPKRVSRVHKDYATGKGTVVQ